MPETGKVLACSPGSSYRDTAQLKWEIIHSPFKLPHLSWIWSQLYITVLWVSLAISTPRLVISTSVKHFPNAAEESRCMSLGLWRVLSKDPESRPCSRYPDTTEPLSWGRHEETPSVIFCHQPSWGFILSCCKHLTVIRNVLRYIWMKWLLFIFQVLG